MVKTTKEVEVKVSIQSRRWGGGETQLTLLHLSHSEELIQPYKLESQALCPYYYRLEDGRGIGSTLLPHEEILAFPSYLLAALAAFLITALG